ncbi:hypothetical protein CHS0354_040190, partial [Potamilus streckersoni]
MKGSNYFDEKYELSNNDFGASLYYEKTSTRIRYHLPLPPRDQKSRSATKESPLVKRQQLFVSTPTITGLNVGK